MNFPRLALVIVTQFALSSILGAQTAVVPKGVTTLVMGLDVPNGTGQTAPGSRVRVPPLEKVILQVPASVSAPIQWRKNGVPISGATDTTLTLPLATTADSGVYTATGFPSPMIATGITLDVVPAGNVSNFSILVTIPPGGSSPSVGFIVAGKTSTEFMIRAVGPSLKAFGIANPAAQPVVHYFDSKGQEIGFVHVAVVTNIDYAATFAAAGAFPLAGSGDFVDFEGFPPGGYSIQVSDNTGVGGAVLLEAYQGANAVVIPPPSSPGAITGPTTILPSGP